MKSEGVRGKDGFIHDDDCIAGNGVATGTGPCTCSILVKPRSGPMCSENGILGFTNEEVEALTSKIVPLTNTFISDGDHLIGVPLCRYCRKHHEGECEWKKKK